MRLVERCGAAFSGARHGHLVYLGALVRAGWRAMAEHVVRVPDWAIPTPSDRFGRRLTRSWSTCNTSAQTDTERVGSARSGQGSVLRCNLRNSGGREAGCGITVKDKRSAVPKPERLSVSH